MMNVSTGSRLSDLYTVFNKKHFEEHGFDLPGLVEQAQAAEPKFKY